MAVSKPIADNVAHCDIFISGGGIAGQLAAAALAHSGFRIIMADPFIPVNSEHDQKADLRSTAFLQPACALFAEIGIWDLLTTHATPLDHLAIIDSTGWPPVIRDQRQFRSDDLGNEPFGWNVMNWKLRHALHQFLNDHEHITPIYGAGFRDIIQRQNDVFITLTDKSKIRAKMAIAADGRDSPLREAVNIGVKTTRYGQKSLAFCVTHKKPHDNISTEIYNQGGPFTIVPIQNIGTNFASAIVWMNKNERAEWLMTLDKNAFETELNMRSTGILGPMQLASHKAIFPIITQTASHLTKNRTALLAEAAHALPPIGAQGLNTSINDIRALVEVANTHKTQLGCAAMMASYEKSRAADISKRARVIDVFNRITRSDADILQSLRLQGLKLIHDITPLRKSVMSAGLGPT